MRKKLYELIKLLSGIHHEERLDGTIMFHHNFIICTLASCGKLILMNQNHLLSCLEQFNFVIYRSIIGSFVVLRHNEPKKKNETMLHSLFFGKTTAVHVDPIMANRFSLTLG